MRIDYEDAVLLLKQIVADRGEDWVYPDFNDCDECSSTREESGEDLYCDWHNNDGCRYFTVQGAPACIVGEFFSRTLQPEDYNRFHLEGRVATEALHYLPLEVDGRTRSLLLVAQQRQDTGDSWGVALTIAIDTASTFTE
jgi:hypothetical protein